jgi:hypothetical protein
MAAPPFAAAKTVSLLVPLLTVWAQSTNPGHPSLDEVTAAFNHWDSASYVRIAEDGYPATTQDPHTVYLAAFLPGYPILIRIAAAFVGGPVAGGLLISAVAEAVALYYIARLVLAERTASSARFVLWAFALSPMAFFLTAVYTESTFIACAAASLFYARQGDHPRACLAAALSCAVRVTGVALIPALAVEIVVRTRARPSPAWLLTALVPAPLLAYGVYMGWHAHDPLAFFAAQSSPSFAHHLAPPWTGLMATWEVVSSGAASSNMLIFSAELAGAALGALACVVLWCSSRIPRSFAVYCTAVWLLSTSISFWLSVPRYELAMFPALLALSDLTRRRPALRAAMITVGCGLMTFGATLYARGLWLG